MHGNCDQPEGHSEVGSSAVLYPLNLCRPFSVASLLLITFAAEYTLGHTES